MVGFSNAEMCKSVQKRIIIKCKTFENFEGSLKHNTSDKIASNKRMEVSLRLFFPYLIFLQYANIVVNLNVRAKK